MKTVFCRIIKPAAAGDDLRVCYTAPRGGRTEAAYVVEKADLWRALREGEEINGRETWTIQPEPDAPPDVRVKCTDEEMAEKLAANIGDMISRKWVGEMFGCKVRKNEVILTCLHDDVTFFAMLNGTEEKGKTVIEVEQ
jgi:hypothetical protein